MSQSSVSNASSIVKAAALIMAVPALLLPMKAAAQQMASVQPDFSACDQLAASAPAKATQCRLDALKSHTAVVRSETVQLERDGQCADQLKALRTRDPGVVERGRVILAGRPLAQFGVCNLLGALTRG